MNTIKQQKLLSSILSSDLIYFTQDQTSKSNANFFSNEIKVNKNVNYNILNINLFIQSLKQLVRLLQYHSQHYKNYLQIISSNTLYNDIINQISKKYEIQNEKIIVRNKVDNKLNSKALIFINFDVVKDMHELLLRTFKGKINSIVLINSYFNKNIFGDYKILTDVNNYKKLLFLITVILLAQTKTH